MSKFAVEILEEEDNEASDADIIEMLKDTMRNTLGSTNPDWE